MQRRSGSARVVLLASIFAGTGTVLGINPFLRVAYAHPGGHVQMSWLELLQHFAEPDHLAFLGLTAIVGWLAFRWGRRLEARARSRERGK